MRALALVVAAWSAVVVLAACGSSSSSPAAAPPPSPEPGGNPTTSQPSPPPSQPTPSPPAPGPSPSPSPAPSPAPAPTPTPDHFADVERLDQDPECDALVPAQVPAPVSVHVTPAAGSKCGRGISEGKGHVAVAVDVGFPNIGWQAFAADGSAEKSFSAWRDVLLPLPEGWQAAHGSSPVNVTTVSVDTWFADGSPRNSQLARPTGFSTLSWSLVPDPLGGSLLTQNGTTSGGGQGAGCTGDARRVAPDGSLGTPGTIGCTTIVAGVSNAGDALVVDTGSGRAVLHWLRPDGTHAMPPSDDGSAGATFSLGPFRMDALLDGSLVVSGAGIWLVRYPYHAVHHEPAPAWLSARRGETFRFTRGNHGYAFFPPAGVDSSDCTQQAELVAPDGRRCARVTFRQDGKACTTGALDQGWDGSVVQQTGSDACSWRVWPGFFAAP